MLSPHSVFGDTDGGEEELTHNNLVLVIYTPWKH